MVLVRKKDKNLTVTMASLISREESYEDHRDVRHHSLRLLSHFLPPQSSSFVISSRIPGI